MTVSYFLWIGGTCTIFKISGKMPCSNDWFKMKVKGLTKTSMLSLRIVTGILVGPRAFRLFKWDISFRASSWVIGLSTNEFNEELLRKFLKFFLDWGMVLFVKKFLKALAMFLGFVTSLFVTVIILGCLLLLCFNVISCRIPFQMKDVYCYFFQNNFWSNPF